MATSANGERNYPNLAPCRVVIRNPNGIEMPPIRMPLEVLSYASHVKKNALVPPYDFAIETQVLDVMPDREREMIQPLKADTTREDLRRSVVTKMRNVTNADETVCVSILESNSYDLKTSIEAYFQSP